jgi:hypothetical protein
MSSETKTMAPKVTQSQRGAIVSMMKASVKVVV